MKLIHFTFLFAFLGTIGTSYAQSENETMEQSATESTKMMSATATEAASPTIVGVAASNENFSTLVAAVKAADLVGTLSTEGPFTVFAPTNAAFDKLPDGTVESLLKPENKAGLTAILTYHVVSGSYDAAAVVEAINNNNGAFPVTTVNGAAITLSLDNGNVVLTDAKGGTATVIMPDVDASNGLIHAIDTLVMP